MGIRKQYIKALDETLRRFDKSSELEDYNRFLAQLFSGIAKNELFPTPFRVDIENRDGAPVFIASGDWSESLVLLTDQYEDESKGFIMPSRDSRIYWSREYLNMAKKALADAGGEYKETSAEKKARTFLDNLSHLTRMECEIGAWPGPFMEPFVIEIDGDKVKGVGWRGSSEYPEPNETKAQLLAYLRKMHLEEWRKEYRPERYGLMVLDGCEWSLKLEYDGGIKPVEYYGHEVYPWNFEALCELFGEDMWTRYDDEEEAEEAGEDNN